VAEVVAAAGRLAVLVMEELHVVGRHRRGLVGIAGLEGRSEELGIGLADLHAQGVGGRWHGNEAGGQQG